MAFRTRTLTSFVMLVMFASTALGQSSCVWNSIASGSVKCRPAEPTIPSSVLKAIGVKGRFYKQYLDFVKLCGSTAGPTCPKGCTKSRGLCGGPSVYQYFACPASPAEQYYTCYGAAESECRSKKCEWSASTSSCSPPAFSQAVSSLLVSAAPRDNERSTFTPTTSLRLWQQAFGSCSFAKYLFQRQVCSSIFNGAPYKGVAKATCGQFPHCTWYVDRGSPLIAGCVMKKEAAGKIWYGGDSGLTSWARSCTVAATQDKCEAVRLA